jgi:hypothetical protein
MPGTATEKDVLSVLDRENRPCELVDGTLVEKAMGFEVSQLALLIGTFLNNFVRPRKLGIVTGADRTIKLFPGLVRIPEVAFASCGCFFRPETTECPDPSYRSRPRCRGPEQGEHKGRNDEEAGRILRGRRACGLDRRSSQADRASLHFRRSIGRAESGPDARGRRGIAWLCRPVERAARER